MRDGYKDVANEVISLAVSDFFNFHRRGIRKNTSENKKNEILRDYESACEFIFSRNNKLRDFWCELAGIDSSYLRESVEKEAAACGITWFWNFER